MHIFVSKGNINLHINLDEYFLHFGVLLRFYTLHPFISHLLYVSGLAALV
jgi:hypothetical protein